MKTEVHQMLQTLAVNDAIGNEVIEIRDLLRSNGYVSNIYAQHIVPELKKKCLHYTEYSKTSSRDNILIFHHSIDSDVTDYVRLLPDRKVMRYHNITPGDFMARYDLALAHRLTKARNELRELAGAFDLALGDSAYNADELRAAGFKKTGVLPILLNADRLNGAPDASVIKALSDGLVNVLFVGRIAPNKRVEDVIKAFCFYQRHINPSSRLVLAGMHDYSSYFGFLEGLVDELSVKNVIFTGRVPQSSLIAYYRTAAVFLLMSEHEGFCVPLVEAMHFNLPVLAFASSAVPETLGNGGILFREKRCEEVAELMDLVLTDEDIRRRITEAQRIRLKDFDREKTGESLISFIEAVRAS